MQTSQTVAVSLGTMFLLVLMGLIFWRRNLTDAEYTFARVVLALAAACVAVLLTGFLKVEYKGYIQATGAFAVFAIVYFMPPAPLRGSPEWQDVISDWSKLRDTNDAPIQVNSDNATMAADAVNNAARAISENENILRPFKVDFGQDYCQLYNQLRIKQSSLPPVGSARDVQLDAVAIELANQLEDKNNVPSRKTSARP